MKTTKQFETADLFEYLNKIEEEPNLESRLKFILELISNSSGNHISFSIVNTPFSKLFIFDPNKPSISEYHIEDTNHFPLSEQETTRFLTNYLNNSFPRKYSIHIIDSDQSPVVSIGIIYNSEKSGNDFHTLRTIYSWVNKKLVNTEINTNSPADKFIFPDKSIFNQILEKVNIEIIVTDQKGIIQYYNSRIDYITQNKNIRRKNISDHFESLSIPEFKKYFETTLHTSQPIEFVSSPSENFFIQIRLEPFFTGNKIVGVVCTLRDISMRQNTLIELESSKSRYRKLSTLTFEGILLHLNATALDVNESLEKITGYSREEIIGKNIITMLVHPDDIPIVTKNMKIDYALPYDIRIINKKKEIAHVEIEARNVVYNNEKMRVVAVRDISRRKQTEKALEESEERLRTLINSTPDIICFKDGKGRWLEANKADIELFQLQGVDINGKTDAELAPFSDFYREAFLTCQDTDEIAWQAGTITRSDEIIPKPDGTKKIYDVIKLPLYHPDGSRKGLVVLGRDITDRRKVQDAFENSERRLKLVLRTANIGLIDWNLTTGKIFINETWKKILGVELGKNNEVDVDFVKSLIHPEDLKIFESNIDKHISGQSSNFECEIRMRYKNANWYWIHAVGKIVQYDEYNNPIRIAGTYQDINESKKIEKARDFAISLNTLNEEYSEQQIMKITLEECQEITDSEIGFIHFVNDDQKSLSLQLWSDSTMKVCDIPGKIDHYPLESAGIWIDCFYSRTPVIHNDYKNSPDKKGFPDGHVDLIRDLTVPVLEGTQVKIILGVGNKRTDYNQLDTDLVNIICGNVWRLIRQKRAESALQQSEEKYRKLVQNSPIGHFIFSQARLVFCNLQMVEIFEYKNQNEMIGSDIEVFSPSTKGTSLADIYQKLTDGDDDSAFAEIKASTFSGKEIDIEINAIRINYENDIAIQGTVTNVSEKLRTREELQRISKLESLGVLAGGIAHNFKNMLTAMSLSIGIAKIKPDMYLEFLEKIEKNIDQANALATRFQTFSTGGDPVKQIININKIIEEAITIALSGTNIVPDLRFDSHLKSIDADPKQMNEVITNLLINASHAMPKGGNICISTSNIELRSNNIANLQEGEYILIKIRDEGIGIPKEIINDIFLPFFTTKSKGNGLGLASVHFIIQKHKGHISVTSTPGKGSEFIIYLPAVERTYEETENGHSDAKFGIEGLKILLMDDNDDIRSNFSILSKEFDLNMVCVADAYQAEAEYRLAIAEKEPFDYVVLDLVIIGSDKDGEDALHMLKAIDPEVKAFVFSGHANKPIVANYQDYGFIGRIAKPLDLNMFFNSIRNKHNDLINE